MKLNVMTGELTFDDPIQGAEFYAHYVKTVLPLIKRGDGEKPGEPPSQIPNRYEQHSTKLLYAKRRLTEMPKPAVREQLDREQCAEADCKSGDHNELFIQAVCHDSFGLTVLYTKTTGVLTIRCGVCSNTVMEILVAREPVN